MLLRAILAGILLAVGVPMLGSAGSAPVGVLLSLVGLAMLVLPTYFARTRTH